MRIALIDDDSGTHAVHRHIRGGGGATVRAALYKTTLVAAARHAPVIKGYHEHLNGQGKARKVASAACMRKRLNYLTALLEEKT